MKASLDIHFPREGRSLFKQRKPGRTRNKILTDKSFFSVLFLTPCKRMWQGASLACFEVHGASVLVKKGRSSEYLQEQLLILIIDTFSNFSGHGRRGHRHHHHGGHEGCGGENETTTPGVTEEMPGSTETSSDGGEASTTEVETTT